jgi:hypothetical protein
MEFRFPALVRFARAPRHTHARPVVIAPRIDVEIPLLTHHDMPEALRVTCSGSDKRSYTEIYRTYAGKLYKKHSWHTVGDLLLSLENPLRFDGVFKPLLGEIGEHLRTVDRAFKPWPDGILAHVQGHRQNPAAAARVIEQTHLVERHGIEEFDHDLDFWREKFLGHVARYAVMERDLWVTSPEPVIQISYGPPVSIGIKEIGLSGTFSENLAQHLFSISEWDAAQAYAKSLTSYRGRLVVDRHMGVEVIVPDVLSKDISGHEIRRAGEHLLRALNQFTPLREGNTLDVERIRLIEEMRRRPFNPEGLATVIEETLTVCRMPHRELGQIPFSHYQASVYRRHLDRWDNRPIEVLNEAQAPSRLLPL